MSFTSKDAMSYGSTSSSGHGPGADVAVSPGQVLGGRYLLAGMLGRGGSAVVHRAVDQVLGRSVAVKVFRSHHEDLTARARQRIETSALANLNHPHLVTVFDAHVPWEPADQGPAYLVMELVDGGTLRQVLRESGLDLAQVARIGAGVAGALSAVHGVDVIHRDIKPGNILIDRDGTAKLSDFGIARQLDAAGLTSAEAVVGTAAYLSPEQAGGGEVGPPSDIYGLGLVLLEAITGEREYPGSPVEAAVARLLREPMIPMDLPDPWPELLTAMTARNPSDRPSAAEVADILGVADDALPIRPVATVGSAVVGSSAAGFDAVGSSAAGFDAAERSAFEPFTLHTAADARARPRRTGVLAGAGALLAVAVVAVGVLTSGQRPASTAEASPVTGSVVGSTAGPVSGSAAVSAPEAGGSVARTPETIGRAAWAESTAPADPMTSGAVAPSTGPTASARATAPVDPPSSRAERPSERTAPTTVPGSGSSKASVEAVRVVPSAAVVPPGERAWDKAEERARQKAEKVERALEKAREQAAEKALELQQAREAIEKEQDNEGNGRRKRDRDGSGDDDSRDHGWPGDNSDD